MLQCSGYTCGTGFSADASKQSTACPSGTCTDGFCCQPAVRLMIRQLLHAWRIEWLLLARLNKPGRHWECDAGLPSCWICSAQPTPVVLASQQMPASSPRHAPVARALTASAASPRYAPTSPCSAHACCGGCQDCSPLPGVNQHVCVQACLASPEMPTEVPTQRVMGVPVP
jgi:hypothetical protein